jgi:hypothetical protein
MKKPSEAEQPAVILIHLPCKRVAHARELIGELRLDRGTCEPGAPRSQLRVLITLGRHTPNGRCVGKY